MKKIQFLKTLDEYRHYMYSEVIKTDIFKEKPFYRGLVDFIIDHRAPIFFEASHEYEYAHFSQYFNFVLMRNNYPNDMVRDMFFMHDFVHMVFDNPVNAKDLDFDYFTDLLNINEYVASNETEILTYYRLPQFRSESLPYPILYDLFQEKGMEKPTPKELLEMRKKIILEGDDAGFGDDSRSEKIFSFLRKFKDLNKKWARIWIDAYPKVNARIEEKRFALPLLEYEKFLEDYKSNSTEEQYQKNILLNVQVAYDLLERSDEAPKTFDECEDAIKKLEGIVVLDKAAQEFDKEYWAAKKAE